MPQVLDAKGHVEDCQLQALSRKMQFRRGNFSFYFPLATSIILSILLTLILTFFRR